MELGLFALLPEQNVAIEKREWPEQVTEEKKLETGDFETMINELVTGPGVAAEQSSIFSTQISNSKRCGAESTGGALVEAVTPITNCPLPKSSCAGTQSSLPSAAFGAAALDPLLALDFENAVSEFLDEVQSLNFSVDMGELGKVELSGGRNESGEFQFQISGSKEALARLLGRVLAAVAGFAGGGGTSSNAGDCGTSGCGGVSLDSFCAQDTLLDLQPETVAAQENVEEAVITGNNGNSQFQEGSVVSSEVDTVLLAEEAQLSSVENELSHVEGESNFEANLEGSTVPETNTGSEQVPEGETLFDIQNNQAATTDETLDRRGVFADQKPDVNTQKKDSISGENLTVFDAHSTKSGEAFAGEKLEVHVKSDADIEQLFDQVFQVLSVERGKKQVTIQLEPKELGKIVVLLTEHDDKIRCVWHVEHPETRALLEENLALLEARAASQGMNLESFVSQQQNSSYGREEFDNFASFSRQYSLDEELSRREFPVQSWSEGRLNLVV
ncbi:flagellar hook-length control protein FliK [Atrimonas thermophila]|uniref:flagellar hook-length control protein FliK n=1 Tax=Atrimonas thermophila TaxID=3064161 RepID=UPI00399C8E6C